MASSSIGKTVVLKKEHVPILAKSIREHKVKMKSRKKKTSLECIAEVRPIDDHRAQ